MIDKQQIVIITGPTAVGKTSLSIEYAKRNNGEIISADSVQVYKYLDIGSAKVSKEEMDGVPHHLIDILMPDEEFGVDKFVLLASEAIDDILSRGKLPIIVGGTAFYIQALLKGIEFNEEIKDNDYLEELYRIASTDDGCLELYSKLKAIDVEYASKTPYQNVRRVIRALEYYHNTGKLFSVYNKEQENRPPKYNYKYYVITDERETLYSRIDLRVDTMLKAGLVEEVRALYNMGYDSSMQSMNSIGYKETLGYLNGDLSYDEMSELIKKNTRHFAKRQLTWFRREKNIIWLDRSKGQVSIE